MTPAVLWCRAQQIAALECLRRCADACQCGHPQCTPEGRRQWLTDAVAEELELTYFAERSGGGE